MPCWLSTANIGTLIKRRHSESCPSIYLSLPTSLLLIVWLIALPPFHVLVEDNPITQENRNLGTTSWELRNTSNDTLQQIKGFASAPSVNKGEQITFYITVNPTQTYTIDFYRMGWYNGTGGRLMHHVDEKLGVVQPSCLMNSGTGLLECTNWSPSHSFIIPDKWTSGIYLARIENAEGFDDYITFTVRDDSRTADFLFQQSVTTYQAYNPYPSNGRTGKSLYAYQSSGEITAGGTRAAVKVSFDRPYSSAARSSGAGEFLMWEVNMVRWIEKEGYDVVYATNIDTHVNANRLIDYKAFLSVGHDEYYSNEMYDALEAARDSGVHLAFFGANAVFWQVRFEPSNIGVPNRVLVCYKNASLDPERRDALKTGQFRDDPVNRPEQQLLGAQYSSQLPSNIGATYIVQNSNHWVWSGSGFSDMSTISGIVGYEVDRQFADTALPEYVSYTVLSKSPFINDDGRSDYQNSVIYQSPSSAWVFDAGTIYWSWGLDNYKRNLADAGIQHATKNILDKFLEAAG